MKMKTAYETMIINELIPKKDKRQSFGYKAHTIRFEGSGRSDIYLKSYDTIVCAIKDGKVLIYDDVITSTTGRHIKEFLYQYYGEYQGSLQVFERVRTQLLNKMAMERKVVL